MKILQSKYVFEVIVIFIGITASFLFEEWRQNSEKNDQSIEIMESMIVELDRNEKFINAYDTALLDLSNLITRVMNKDTSLTGTDIIDLNYDIQELNSMYRLSDISFFINGFTSSDQLSLIDKNKDIVRVISYIKSLEREHAEISISISKYSADRVWPILNKYDISSSLIDLQKVMNSEEQDGNNTLSDDNLKKMVSDKKYLETLQWIQFKTLRLIYINQYLKMQIGSIKNILRETIRASK